ncbi:hypothetical protein FH972_022169 [Carpinus fangiana]|uniref:Sodium/calcium exchanger membrane region domain-containing protein n=1 Tax=Carpinus fangiana TaxID=176857 RepID=A0A5N6KRG8_9ROSI|nr:hypothetical protein FH972_022169 [Carpinus fangiana]
MADSRQTDASSAAGSSASANIEAGSSADDGGRGATTPETTRRKPRPLQSFRFDGSEEVPRDIVVSPDGVSDPKSQNRPRRPTTGSRRSSSKGLPFRGQEFSVDDDPTEIDSPAESFTLKDRQEAINETHPFGIRIWKPALYKKGRSVEKDAEGDIHSTPGGNVSKWLWLFNFAWTLIFGWWLALVAAIGGLICHLFPFAPSARDYGVVLWGLAGYLFYPFGKYVKLIQEEAYAEEDQGEGRSLGEYERWQTGDLEEGRLFFGPVRSLIGRRRSEEDSDEDETTSLLGRNGRSPNSTSRTVQKRRLFGRGDWTFGRIVFFIYFWAFLTPLLLVVGGICWLLVFTIPMGRVTMLLFDHLRRHPLALEFHHDSTYIRGPGNAPSSILLCTYRAVGTKYWKYTVDGTNVFLINLLGVVVFVIFDYFVLDVTLGMRNMWTSPIVVFLLALFSIIPLAYFIGQAVASISAQSTMGVGAAINAFFSTIVEVFLYCVALNQGKSRLVEGSIIGSIFAGILFLPGISMCFGAIKRKTQRFNVKSAGVTTTMLLFAVIGAFGPTLFYQIFGSHEMNCHQCIDEHGKPLDRDCRKCYFAQIPSVHDKFYRSAVQPFTWFAAVLLFLAYVIGLLFTLRTHAATIWNTEVDEKKMEKMDHIAHRASVQPGQKISSIDYGTVGGASANASLKTADIRDSQLYKRILNQSLKQAGVAAQGHSTEQAGLDGSISSLSGSAPATTSATRMRIDGMNKDESDSLIRQIAEMAATAAAVATRDATSAPRRVGAMAKTSASSSSVQHASMNSQAERPTPARMGTLEAEGHIPHGAPGEAAASGGHDAPNWSRTKSYTILMTATVAYAIIAEILVDTVDAVLENVDIDEKFLGITLFALVPNTTEFLNAISFAMNGNIALSMEIGSAYALQVCLLQIPALVLFSAVYGQYVNPKDVIDHTFVLLFPQWDMVTVILCVFLLSYMYGEGKSNYFKGSILILSYLVVVVGFYLSDLTEGRVMDPNGPKHRHRAHKSLDAVHTMNTWAHDGL